jgi:RNA polymerase sigma-70 factor (ECF subfamily)
LPAAPTVGYHQRIPVPSKAAGTAAEARAMDTTSVSLLERLRRPAAEADWVRFVNLYTPLCLCWARRLGLRDADAADLVQEVFTLLVQKLPEFTYDRDRSFRCWLKTVLLNKWREGRRGQQSGPPGAGDLADWPGPDTTAEAEEAEVQQHLAVGALQLMQAEFQPTTWRACWEHVVCGRPAADVARELDISVNAVYLATSRVLRRLRQELAGMLD